MTFNTAIIILLIGVLAGLISRLAANNRGRGFGLLVHVIVGVIGAYHGRHLFQLAGLGATSLTGHLIFACVGALLFLYPLRFIKPT
jgi:uncharacterized membrane protein YeaQ/YmgE (transglycosylase-associated protein family)